MAAVFEFSKIFAKIDRTQICISLNTLWVENFDEIALSHTVKEIEANLCFAIFGKNSKIQKWPPFLGRGKFLPKLQNTNLLLFLNTLWRSKISTKSLYLARLRR